MEDAPVPVGPAIRPRRLRTTPALRRLVAEASVEARQLILPMFVREDLAEPRPMNTKLHALERLYRVVAEELLPRLRALA